MKIRFILAATVAVGLATSALVAQVRDAVTSASFVFNGQELRITQSSGVDTAAVSRHFVRAPDCIGVCIAPTQAAAGIVTIAERDVISFVQNEVAAGAGLLLDGRTPERRAQGYIATSVNIPLDLMEPDNPFLSDILIAMGATRDGANLDFTNALPLIVFDDGPTTNDAANLIQALRENGYPAQLIRYYRGGMQVWTALGLSTENT